MVGHEAHTGLVSVNGRDGSKGGATEEIVVPGGPTIVGGQRMVVWADRIMGQGWEQERQRCGEQRREGWKRIKV